MYLKRKLSKITVLIAVMMLGMMLFVGCGSENSENTDLFQHIQQQTETFSQNSGQAKVDTWTYITEGIYKVCNSCKKGVPYVCIISIFIGVLIRHLVQEDQAVRKKAWVFIAGIPILSIIFTFGLAALVETFL